VRHAPGGRGADAREAECLGDCGHDGNGTIGGDGQDALNGVPAADLDDALEVGEVDDLGDIGRLESESLCVAVDGDDAVAELADVLDGAPLMPSGADEEDRCQRVPSVFAQVAGEPPRR
jgi:hypothetical protein